MFLCKFCDFIILSLTHNRGQKTHAGEREEKVPVRQVFPVSFVSFQYHVSLISVCVSSSPLFLHSLFSFRSFLVFDVFLPPSYSLFALQLSPSESITPASVHLYLLDSHGPRWPVKCQDTALLPSTALPPHKQLQQDPSLPGVPPLVPPVPLTSTGPCCSILSPMC